MQHVNDSPGQDERLAIVVPVGPHTQVHLFGVGVGLESLGDTQDRVGGSHLDAGPPGGAARAGGGDALLEKGRFSGQGHGW